MSCEEYRVRAIVHIGSRHGVPGFQELSDLMVSFVHDETLLNQ